MPSGIYKRKPQTSEHIQNKIDGRKGYKHSKETIDKIRNSNLGKKPTDEARKNMSLAQKGRVFSEEHRKNIGKGNKGKRKIFTEEHKINISIAKKKEYKNGRVSPFKKLWEDNPNFLRGENNPVWIKDRSKLAKRQERNDSAYREWRLNVYKRDNYKCRICNKDCSGRIMAHHILGWAKFPELRYQVNNGITLCQAHHPKGRAEEKRLSPYFEELVSVSN